jgi:flagellar hook-associated protein 3 FlgL
VIGRITTLMTAQATLSDLAASFDRLSQTQQEMSSGKKISQPSDDPYGMSVVINQQSQLGMLKAYTNNVSDGTAWTQAGQASMTNIANVVQRVRELVVGAANGTNTQADLNGSAAEVKQLIAAVKTEANTQYNGQYVFSGTANVSPYQTGTGDLFQGNSGPAGAVTRLIGPNTNVQVNVDLSSVLGNGSAGAGGSDGKLLDTLNSIYSDMTSGNTNGLGNTDLKSLDTNFNALTQMQASLGATSNSLELASSRIQSMQISATQVLSNTQDADMAQVAIDYSTQQAAYDAALKAGASIVQSSLMDFLK